MRGVYFYGCIIICTAGVVAFDALMRIPEPHTLNASVGQRITLPGAIVEDPVMTARHQKVVFATDGTRIIAFAPLYPTLAYGDVITARGVLEHPRPFETGSGRMFDYPAYLAKNGIFYVLDRPTLAGTGAWEGNRVKRRFIDLRHAFVHAIERTVSEPYAGLAAGVVLGVPGALSKDDEELFRDAGLIHIVVVSGYNITLVGDMAARALARFPTIFASLGSLISITAFIMTTGASATAIRAGIMATLVLIARLTKRHYDMQRALFAAGFLMVLHTPSILLHDPSFQLSFCATWGLGTLTAYTQRLFRWVPLASLRDIAATTLATQTAVAPLLFYMSGKVSVLSLPANVLALPVIPLFMAGALVIGILGFLPSIVLLPVSLIVQCIGAYVFTIARFFAP